MKVRVEGAWVEVRLPMGKGGAYCRQCGARPADGVEHACQELLMQLLARRTAALFQIFLAAEPNRKPNSFDTVHLMRAECRRLVLESGVPMDGLDDELRNEEIAANRRNEEAASANQKGGKAESWRHLFHRLWTRDVGRPGYDKQEWLKLEKYVFRALEDGPTDNELARTKRELEVLYERIGALCRALGDAPKDPAHHDMTQLELRVREKFKE